MKNILDALQYRFAVKITKVDFINSGQIKAAIKVCCYKVEQQEVEFYGFCDIWDQIIAKRYTKYCPIHLIVIAATYHDRSTFSNKNHPLFVAINSCYSLLFSSTMDISHQDDLYLPP